MVTTSCTKVRTPRPMLPTDGELRGMRRHRQLEEARKPTCVTDAIPASHCVIRATHCALVAQILCKENRTQLELIIARPVLIQPTASRAPEIGLFKHDRTSNALYNGTIPESDGLGMYCMQVTMLLRSCGLSRPQIIKLRICADTAAGTTQGLNEESR
jgi:hypothetical protein